MHIHILGICGTFMSGVAILAKQSGYQVSGSDMNVYPPMSTQLIEQGIHLLQGYDPAHIDKTVDMVVVGNVIKRGNPAIEYVLANRIPYVSGPAWLFDHVLKDRIVLGVAGTHGKTTTSSMLAFILDEAGLAPGFLIGGIPQNFGVSARLGAQRYFVIEADEYDAAFFDKRSKFIHYHPMIMILNNLEFDHADIFPNLDAIKQQFHHLLKTIPGNGMIIRKADDTHLTDVIAQGCYTPVTTFGAGGKWQASLIEADGSSFDVYHQDRVVGRVQWDLLGLHNVDNALAAIAAAYQVNIKPKEAVAALAKFKNVKRRLEIKAQVKDILIYDDFAHHPTAIASTLMGLRAKIGKAHRMIAVVEFGSYTMRTGVHKDRIRDSFETADMVVCKNTTTDWGLQTLLAQFPQPTALYNDVDRLVSDLAPTLRAGDHVIIMSNAGFDGVCDKLIHAIEKG